MSAQIPPGTGAVKVSVISPNRVLGVPASAFLQPDIPGTTYNDTPCFAFLVEHKDEVGHLSCILFDLGIRKDWENSPPAVVDAVRSMNIQISTEKDAADLLVENGRQLSSIDAIVFSHWHFDHTGNVDRFPKTTKIVVGPGFKSNMLPGFPTDPHSMIDETAFQKHEIQEVSFDGCQRIARLDAWDYFGDGSFYILDSPGHAVGHLSALARTSLGESSSDDTFVLLAGDVSHHAGELRPSQHLNLPNVHQKYLAAHPCSCGHAPFYTASPGGFNLDPVEMQRTVEKIQTLDSNPNVFTILSHDNWLLDVIDLLPSDVNGWKSQDWAERSRWRFLQDFELESKPQ